MHSSFGNQTADAGDWLVARGTAASGLLGFLYDLLATCQRGICLAMITFALSQMVYFIAVQASFTGGEDGLQGVPRGYFLGLIDLSKSLNIYYFELGVFILALLLIARFIHSPFAIRSGHPRHEGQSDAKGYRGNGSNSSVRRIFRVL